MSSNLIGATNTTANLSNLTPREREALEGIVDDGSNRTIASALGISSRTVEVHRRKVAEKLGVRGAAAMTYVATQSGVLPADGISNDAGQRKSPPLR